MPKSDEPHNMFSTISSPKRVVKKPVRKVQIINEKECNEFSTHYRFANTTSFGCHNARKACLKYASKVIHLHPENQQKIFIRDH